MADGDTPNGNAPYLDEFGGNVLPTQTGMEGARKLLGILALPPAVRDAILFKTSHGEGQAGNTPSAGGASGAYGTNEAGRLVLPPVVNPEVQRPFSAPVISPQDRFRMQRNAPLMRNPVSYETPLGAFPSGSPAPASSADTTWLRMINQESGGKQFSANGTPLVSPAGAVGIAQVLPATGEATAKAHGVPWDPNRFSSDSSYNAMLGRLYYNDQLAKYGDPSLAAAAYNAGPGAVDDALKRASETGTSWMSHLPKETQAYVANVTGGGTGGGTGTGASSVAPTMAKVLQGEESQGGALRDTLRAELQLALLRNMFPQHELRQVEYDPWAIQKGEVQGAKRSVNVNEGV